MRHASFQLTRNVTIAGDHGQWSAESILAAAAAAGSVLLGFYNLQLGEAAGIVVAAVLLLRARPDCILPLLICHLSAREFFQTSDESTGDVAEWSLVIGGFPVSVQLVINVLAPVCVIVFLIRRPGMFHNAIRPSLLILWFLAFIPVLIGTWLGKQADNETWTRGLRFLMMIAAYLYGFVWAKRWNRSLEPIIINGLTGICVLFLGAAVFGFYGSHLASFLLLGMAGPLAFHYFRQRSVMATFIGVVLVIESLLMGFRTTFTVQAICILGLVVGFLGQRQSLAFRRRSIAVVWGSTIVVLWAFVLLICLFGKQLDVNLDFLHIDDELTQTEKVQAKIFGDRLILWEPAFQQIIDGPYFVVPTGRALELENRSWGIRGTWTFGAHNTLLEVLRQDGLFAGSVMLAILCVALFKNFQALRRSINPLVIILSSTVLAVGTVGMTTGDFPLDFNVGFLLWSFAGLAAGLHLEGGNLSKIHRRELPEGAHTADAVARIL